MLGTQIHMHMHINARTVRAALSSGIDMARGTYLDGKRDLFRWQKRPIHMVRAALSSGIDMAKETYLDGKRYLFRWQKRPI